MKEVGKDRPKNFRNGHCSNGDLKSCSNQQLLESGIFLKFLKKLRETIKDTLLAGDPPANTISINHRNNPLEQNPYKGQYGVDTWEKEVRKSAFLSNLVCITDLVLHMYEQTKACFVGSEYASSFYFYHNALS